MAHERMGWTVTLEHEAAWTGAAGLQVTEATFTLPTTGQAGQATVVVPKRHPAARAAYIGEAARSFVRLEHAELGVWDGAVARIEETPDRLTLTAYDLGQLLATRTVGQEELRAYTAGILAYYAFVKAFAGLNVRLRPAVPVESAPVMPSFEFNDQTVLDVYRALHEQSGQEWTIRERVVRWGPPTGRTYGVHLFAEGDLRYAGRSIDLTEIPARAVARTSLGLEAVAVNAERATGRWPLELRLTSDALDPRALQAAADTALAEADAALIVVNVELRGERRGLSLTAPPAGEEGNIPRGLAETAVSLAAIEGHPWGAVREGDRLQITLPNAGLRDADGRSGTTGLYRVRARTYRDGGSLLGLSLQRLPAMTATAAARATAAHVHQGALHPERAGSHLVRSVVELRRAVAALERAG